MAPADQLSPAYQGHVVSNIEPATRRARRKLVADIRVLVADLPPYGYRRVHALLRWEAEKIGREAPNPKRVYRVMNVHGLLLQWDGERREERRHDGRVAVELRNTRWCSDGLEITCDNGEKVRVAFALDCCDRESRDPWRQRAVSPPRTSRT